MRIRAYETVTVRLLTRSIVGQRLQLGEATSTTVVDHGGSQMIEQRQV